MYRTLDSRRVLVTAERLAQRVGERFPGSGLSNVARELVEVARESEERVRHVRRPHWPARVGAGLGVLVMVSVAVAALATFRVPSVVAELTVVLETLETVINDLVFLGLAVFFLVTLESRLKRRDAIAALHELRSLVHIIDMHQLTKDPERVLGPAKDTPSSPVRRLTRFELARYLDYCSEMLSITSKLAALHGQEVNDPVVLAAVNDVEQLADGLSSKIWQKIMILDTVAVTEGSIVS